VPSPTKAHPIPTAVRSFPVGYFDDIGSAYLQRAKYQAEWRIVSKAFSRLAPFPQQIQMRIIMNERSDVGGETSPVNK
jgi:hypothetical protein